MNSTVRIEKWDSIKGILIILVVLGHLADFYTGNSERMRALFLYIYIFHMPLFVFLSGMFAKKMIQTGNKEKIAGYFVLYIWLEFIFWIYRAIAYGNYSIKFFNENGLPWFIFALFVFPILTRLVRNISPKYVLFISVLLSCVIGYDSNVTDFLCLSRIIVYFPFYYVGYLLDYKKLGMYQARSFAKVCAGAFLIVVAAIVVICEDKIYWIRPMLTGRNPYVTLGDYEIYGFLIRLGVYVLAALMIVAIVILAPVKWKGRLLIHIGKNTLPIYVFHYIVLFILYNHLHIREKVGAVMPEHGGLIIIPLAIVISLVLSLAPFVKITELMYKIPMKTGNKNAKTYTKNIE